MSELLGRNFLRALSNASQRMARGDSESAVQDGVAALSGSAEVLVAGPDEAVLSIVGDAFYLGRTVET